jgi:hypothetical protein
MISKLACDKRGEGSLHGHESLFRELLPEVPIEHQFPEGELAVRMLNTLAAVIRMGERRFEEAAFPAGDRRDVDPLWHVSSADADLSEIPGVEVRRL